MAAVRIKEAGINDIRIIDQAGDFGGTWYWNRYPGAQCDIDAYIYLPLLEELGYIPKSRYSDSPEIFAHCQEIGKHYGLYENACFHTKVVELEWLEEDARWIISTDRQDRMKARYICLADGPLTQPKLPGIRGIEDFKGHIFHTSRWDYDYTGGSPEGDLSGLQDRSVAIIGTGATGIQCIPYVAKSCKQLYVFQRTPSSILERNNAATDINWAASLEPGWQRKRMTNFNRVSSGEFEIEDLVNDSLTQSMRKLGSRLYFQNTENASSPDQIDTLLQMDDWELMEEVRKRVDDIVIDETTASHLKPWYRLFCKRPCFNDDYLHTFNRENVSLIDTDGKGIDGLSHNGVVAKNREYSVDCIIFATGFEVGTSYPTRSGFEVYGRENYTLTEKWADGIRTLHGIMSHGFPNCFFLGITQGAYTANYTHMLYEQAHHISHLIGSSIKKQKTIEPGEWAENDWVKTIISKSNSIQKFSQECTPGYYNNEGEPGKRRSARIPAYYGGPSEEFFNIIREWRETDDFAGIEFN